MSLYIAVQAEGSSIVPGGSTISTGCGRLLRRHRTRSLGRSGWSPPVSQHERMRPKLCVERLRGAHLGRWPPGRPDTPGSGFRSPTPFADLSPETTRVARHTRRGVPGHPDRRHVSRLVRPPAPDAPVPGQSGSGVPADRSAHAGSRPRSPRGTTPAGAGSARHAQRNAPVPRGKPAP